MHGPSEDIFNSLGLDLPEDPAVRTSLKQVLGYSEFVVATCRRYPGLLEGLLKSRDLQKKYSPDEFSVRLNNFLVGASSGRATVPVELASSEFASLLRQYRNREMVRIAWRDLSGWSDLSETMADLSALADTCIDTAFSFLHQQLAKKQGTPVGADGSQQQIVVLGLGKLGARELNFSSDVDLMLAYPESGQTRGDGAQVENEEFFTRLSRNFLKLFSSASEEGILFRVDLRLRPFGENGPLVMSFNATEEYYEAQGREWERYALIKARIVAGDKNAGNTLLKRLEPFVYRRYLDYGTFEALRDMKMGIALEVKRKGLKDNIKLGAGGIREIEFFGQVFQLIRGGVDPELQEPAVLKVLKTLVRKGLVTQTTHDELVGAYYFLRTTEHRLQEFADQQTHFLPADPGRRSLLSQSLGFDEWDDFFRELGIHMRKVHDHFTKILAKDASDHEESRAEKEMNGVWQDLLEEKQKEEAILAAGYEAPARILGLLDRLRNDHATRALSREGRQRLDRLIPHVIRKAGLSEQPEISLKRILELIKTIQQRTSYLALFLENPVTLDHVIKLSDASPWIVSFLSRHPVLLDELLDTRTLYRPPSRQELEQELEKRFEPVPLEDLEYQIETLCIFKQVNTLRVAAADVGASYPLMRVSDHLSDIAELVISKVLDLSWDHLIEKNGVPGCTLGNEPCGMGFAVISYGKLGGIELGYGSDLDLVFLHAASEGQTSGENIHAIANGFFYARLGQRVIHILTTHTRAGTLYDTDMRLRPSGSSGPLVSHVDAFREYLDKEAWIWEHQALVRARIVCGDPAIARHFNQTRNEILCRSRDRTGLREEIARMRDRMRNEHGGSEPGVFNIKQGRGGIVDIEFLVQYLVLLNAETHNELVQWPDNIRQLEALAEAGILTLDTSRFLKEAYLTYRAEVHRLSLQEKSANIPEEAFHDLRENVKKIWDRYMLEEMA